MSSQFNPASEKQQKALVAIIRRVGKNAYRSQKQRLGIPIDTPITRLSKQQAWLLINHYSKGVS